MIKLMMLTNNVQRAVLAEKAGVNRIFIDLEKRGKEKRQAGLNTIVPYHDMSDISNMKEALTQAQVLARVNPYYEGTKEEIDECVSRGADIIMLPMFRTKNEVVRFISDVNGRSRVSLLLETSQALVRLQDYVEVEGIDELYVGFNDLRLDLHLDFLFELLASGLIDFISQVVTSKHIEFGFGGLARVGAGVIPVENIIPEHIRLKSSLAILSQAFDTSEDIEQDILKLRTIEKNTEKWNQAQYMNNQFDLRSQVFHYVNGDK